MRSAYSPPHLHRQTLYAATMQNIYTKERDGFAAYTRAAEALQAATPSKCPRNPKGLQELYNSGRDVYDRYHKFIKRMSKASPKGRGYVFRTKSKKQPPMKGIYRVLEKGVFKYNDDLTWELDFSRVRDLVRGGIIDFTMRGLGAISEAIRMSDEVTVVRIKDRFNSPSSAGWADCMINFYFNDDPLKHVCEVQLIHFKMLSQRTTQEGHGAYNIHRVYNSIAELEHCNSVIGALHIITRRSELTTHR